MEISEVAKCEADLPRRVVVQELLESRYVNGFRPSSWDKRVSGFDKIRTKDGETLLLNSSGGQSPPHNSWEILLMSGDSEQGYLWTLYALRN